MKKLIAILVTFVLVPNICLAMTLSQPQEIGWFGLSQAGKGSGGVVLRHAAQNTGHYFTKYDRNNRESYEKGIARFGNGDNALYVHYDVDNQQNPIWVGGVETSNTIPVLPLNETISKIETDCGITIYTLHYHYGPEQDYAVIGRTTDGKFVKYIDTTEITRKYFGEGEYGASPAVYSKLEARGDTIIVRYRKHEKSSLGTAGEFRFKWDEQAQWFGIEQVVY